MPGLIPLSGPNSRHVVRCQYKQDYRGVKGWLIALRAVILGDESIDDRALHRGVAYYYTKENFRWKIFLRRAMINR